MQMEFDALEQDVEMDVRLNARCTWRFFETSAADSHLRVGHQKAQECLPSLGASPTNLGRLLVWTMAAHELGVVGTLELAERLESVLSAMENLQFSHEGRSNSGPVHTFAPTTPQHVLIGETGNLAGFVRAALTALPPMPPW